MNGNAETFSVNNDAARGARFPEVALRRRAADHPMGFFAIATAGALLSISVVSYNATPEAVAQLRIQPAQTSDVAAASQKGDRLQPLTRTERACEGQTWGSENAECLVAIAKDGGKNNLARIRTISGA